MHPSVRELELSRDRVNYIIKELITRFNETAIGRRIVKPVSLERDDKRCEEKGFISIGFNHILDRIWFVDGVIDGSSYGYQGIGGDFAEGISEAEASYITRNILEKCSSSILTFENTIRPSDILRAIESLNNLDIGANMVLTNVREHVKLWHYPNLTANGRLCVPKAFSGYRYDIPIEFFRGLPEGTSLILNAEKLGDLLIKQSLVDTASISDIDPSEYEKLLQEIPSIKVEELPEKVRFLAYETVKINIVDPNAVVILQEKGKLPPETKMI